MRIRLDDDLLDRLGRFFVHQQFHQRYGITFAQFLHMREIGTWKDFIS